ncbi:D-alanyl-D-alanine carboxypeptidase [Virgibacillus sp. MSJ-26]|uniref:D-alanyl-D-alanine carboxypeptidase family protein n=1 Tax=Virgibacillus sp. MSJ-26 TaxID=2841522 RepID=UPI001C1180E4|nr:D-alanyl-D-alanine carboxypeptidase [Virgibacillus sp. MSJ-26]
MRPVYLIICSSILLLVMTVTSYAQPKVDVSAEASILLDQSTGDVLYEKNAHNKQQIASITKIMTAIIAIELGQMNEEAKTSRRAIYTEGSSIYLEQGEKMTIEDLLYGLMLRSGNDAAVAISEHIGGSVEGFVHLMNEKAKWLGMTNTQFANPHGLTDEDHYSTAYDMAILMQYAMANEEFRKISGTTSYQAENRTYYWQNKNKFLTKYYEYSTGGKTGFTKKSGRTLITTAKKDNIELIAVTLNAPDDWNDHTVLYEWGFENHNVESSNLSMIEDKKTETVDRNILTDSVIIYKKLIGFNLND